MKEVFYQKENNIFQSLNWLAFQEEYGRKAVYFKDFSGIIFDLPFGKEFVWVQKAPKSTTNLRSLATNLSKNCLFIRIEPEEITDKDIKKHGLKKVTKRSLLCGQKSPEATRVLDISASEKDILAQMKPKTRYNIRLAEKRGVEVKMLDNEDILYDLLLKTAERDKGYFPHEKTYYTKMIKDLAKNDLAHIFVAEHEGDFLAAIIVTFFGDVATYLHGGFNDTKRNLMATYLCQWAAIKHAKERGFKYYDFWGVALNDGPKDPWAGITKFKEGFGGEKIIFPGSYDLVIDKKWYLFLTLMARARRFFK